MSNPNGADLIIRNSFFFPNKNLDNSSSAASMISSSQQSALSGELSSSILHYQQSSSSTITNNNNNTDNNNNNNNNNQPPPWWNLRLAFYRLFDHDKEDAHEKRRIVRGADPLFNAKFKYCNNRIKTSRYNIFTFIPLNLFEQFLRIANCYFLFLVILQSIPMISPIPPIAQAVCLAAVIFLTGVKYGVDDIFRHRSDKRINSRQGTVLISTKEGFKLQTVTWKEIKVGQIVALKNNEDVPADLLLLSSSEGTGLCFIETAELDGENNLKYRQSLEQTQQLGNDLYKLGSFKGEVLCEPPNNNLTRFDGYLLWQGEKYSLNNDNLLLRGCTVRNTQWAFGLVLYAGRQTKLMKNTGKSQLKRTRIDKSSNKYFFGIFSIMLVITVIAAVLSYVFESGTGIRFKLAYSVWMPFPGGGPNPATIAVIQMWSHLILIQTLVPIALYLTFESIQALLSRGFINADLQMYHAETDTRAEARTTTLNEDLGQIEYIFSDKTGTLTQNVMTFNRCSIAGRKYGPHKEGQRRNKIVDFSKHEPRFWEPSFRFYDRSLLDEVQIGSTEAYDFFLLIALCHTINAEIDERGKLTYKAQSPDEAALVAAARNFGFVYKSRTQSSVTLEILGVEVTYNVLCLLEFDNTRKRMSIVVAERHNYGRRRLFCKGADNTVLPLIRSQSDNEETMLSKTKQHLHEFSSEGLRTLVCAARDIDDDEWAVWLKKFKAASTTLHDRGNKLAKCYTEIEQNLNLIGVTAVEDKLQDGVPETISKLSLAGIKVWVLTGDKQETAINVGYLANILNDETHELIVDAEQFADVEQQLLAAKQQLEQAASPSALINNGPEPSVVSLININGIHINLEQLPQNNRNNVLIINGHSLYHALMDEMENLFLKVACACQAVICCRVAPLQKGRVVDLVKRRTKGLTLAVGDGANDVNMIKTAHIGVGISGQEGRQAVLASDFSLAQFRFLQRLLLVHGRRAYFRVATFMKLFFYKTFAFTLCQIWYAIYCGWSANSIYDSWFLMGFNLVYTSTPVLYYAVCEQDVNDYYSLKFPKLYQPGLTNKFFNLRNFLLAELEGVFHSVVTYFIMCYGLGNSMTANGNVITTSKAAMGIAIGTAVVIVVTVRCSIETSYWTVVNVTPILSIGTTFLLQYLLSELYANINLEFETYGIYTAVWASPSFWLSCIVAVVICCLPVYTIRFLFFIFKPSLSNRIQILRFFEDETSWVYKFGKLTNMLKVATNNMANNNRNNNNNNNNNKNKNNGGQRTNNRMRRSVSDNQNVAGSINIAYQNDEPDDDEDEEDAGEPIDDASLSTNDRNNYNRNL